MFTEVRQSIVRAKFCVLIGSNFFSLSELVLFVLFSSGGRMEWEIDLWMREASTACTYECVTSLLKCRARELS